MAIEIFVEACLFDYPHTSPATLTTKAEMVLSLERVETIDWNCPLPTIVLIIDQAPNFSLKPKKWACAQKHLKAELSLNF